MRSKSSKINQKLSIQECTFLAKFGLLRCKADATRAINTMPHQIGPGNLSSLRRYHLLKFRSQRIGDWSMVGSNFFQTAALPKIH
ncbi:hypothetical protein SAMN05192553_103119 [Cyclobacterium xiamenense]|uniref:Uncharacterized protein n=1 Tax=Cyclobacterium xiamenense TaxID=1297121 RepID=A0A1H6XLM6_9BACT|nr:hypothetical protein SAMN05192553_103119 [Cyclobacterium xiamenense]